MKKDARIISLIASSTEIVCALGFEKNLVGRSHECDFPLFVKNLPVCTETKFLPDGTSYEIDQKVKAILQEGLSVYRVFGEKLKELRPDIIITQTQCEVCAVSEKDVMDAVCTWLDSRPQIVSLEPNSLVDVWRDIQKVANAMDASERGENLITNLKKRIETIRSKTAKLSARPSVACIEWIDPLMAAGNWMPELVEFAGGKDLFGIAGKHSPWMSWEELCTANPDIIVALPCGFDIPRTLQEMPVLKNKKKWKTLSAVRNNKVFVADGNQYFNRPGPRLVESLEILCELIHPQEFSFEHKDKGWIHYA